MHCQPFTAKASICMEIFQLHSSLRFWSYYHMLGCTLDLLIARAAAYPELSKRLE